jgi:hypothetical protein
VSRRVVLSWFNLPTKLPLELTWLSLLTIQVCGASHGWRVAMYAVLALLWAMTLLNILHERPVHIENLRAWRDR